MHLKSVVQLSKCYFFNIDSEAIMMQEKTMVQTLQRTRHDLMNNLQVIQGYLSMDKIDIVKEKLTECIDYYHEERKLININAPHFILWVIQFNHCHDNIQLTYHVDEHLDLASIDHQLIKDSKHLVNIISKLGSKMELYELNLQISMVQQSKVKVSFTIVDQFELINEFQDNKQNDNICVKESEDGIIYELSYIIE